MTTLTPAQGWIETATPRLSAPPAKQRGLLFRGVSRLSRTLGRNDVPDVISVLHINPRLFWAWLFFASRMMPYGRLPPRQREMLILRTAWNCRSRYEWGQHVEIGLRAGLSDDDILCASGRIKTRNPVYALLIQACDELCQQHVISDATWNALCAHYSKPRLIEITMLVGHYVMIAAFLNSAGLRLEAPLEEVLNALHQRLDGSPC